MEIGIGSYIYQLFLARLSLLPVLHRRDTILGGCCHLHAVAVGKSGLELRYTEYAVLHQTTVSLIPFGRTSVISFGNRSRSRNLCNIIRGIHILPIVQRPGNAGENRPGQCEESHRGCKSQQISFLGNLHYLSHFCCKGTSFSQENNKNKRKNFVVRLI